MKAAGQLAGWAGMSVAGATLRSMNPRDGLVAATPRRSAPAWYDRGMTKKIGVSLRDDLYEWAAREVEEGRAESVSALIAEGLQVLAARAQLEELIADLRAEVGELDEETKARVEEAMGAMEEAQRRHLAKRMGSAA